jgi:hypothetical protein
MLLSSVWRTWCSLFGAAGNVILTSVKQVKVDEFPHWLAPYISMFSEPFSHNYVVTKPVGPLRHLIYRCAVVTFRVRPYKSDLVILYAVYETGGFLPIG